MDPITIIGLTASVIQLIAAARNVLDVIKSFKDGEKELTTLAQDVSFFSEALKSFDRVLRSKHTLHRVSGPVIDEMLEHSKRILQDLRTQIIQIGSSSLSTIRKAKWVQYKPSIIKLHIQLKEKADLLHMFLSIAHTESFMTIASQLPDFVLSHYPEFQETTTSQVAGNSTSSEPFHLHVPTLGSRPRKYINNSDITSFNSFGTASLMDSLSLVSTANRLESSMLLGPSFNSDQAADPGKPETQTLIGDDNIRGTRGKAMHWDMFVTRRSCHYKCHCQCHEETAAKSRRRFIRGSKIRKVQCSSFACLGNEAPQKPREELLRSFRNVLSFAMSAKSVQARYNLETFRLVPDGADSMRYVKQGNLEKLRACIESGEATIWDIAPDGWSFLHCAAYNAQPEIVKYLLEIGVSTQTGEIGARIPADFAILKSIGKDATESEKQLVELFDARNDILADFEFTPIHTAVLNLYSHDDHERPSLEELIQLTDEANNARPGTDWSQWKTKYRGRSPLFDAILEYFRASAFGSPSDMKIIHHLIDQKDKKYHWTPLHWAASSGRVKEMRILVEYGADPALLSNLGANIIHAAVESKFDQGLVAALEIWKRCSGQIDLNQVNAWGETAIHVASSLSASCVKMLLDAGADPRAQDENGQVALHFAGLSAQVTERPQIVSVLCSTVDTTHINMRDHAGRPPVFDFLDDIDCVELLVRHGARIDVTDGTGQNALHHACYQGEDTSLKFMLEHPLGLRAAVARDNNGNTPLILALLSSQIECALTLLQLEDVGQTVGSNGWAPIHYAAKIGDPELLQMVCRHSGFVRSSKTHNGQRASEVAMEAGTWDGRIKELIRQYDYIDWEIDVV